MRPNAKVPHEARVRHWHFATSLAVSAAAASTSRKRTPAKAVREMPPARKIGSERFVIPPFDGILCV
jgi:hypothetical protein